MSRTFEGKLTGEGLRIAIVVGRFNSIISEKLLAGARDTLVRHGVDADAIDVAWVPGAFELPLVAKRMASTSRYQAVCALGVVIRGGTPHFDYVCSEAAGGLSRASLDTGIPVIFGVLTTDNLEQAMERAGSKGGNKGSEAAAAAIEMANLLSQLTETV